MCIRAKLRAAVALLGAALTLGGCSIVPPATAKHSNPGEVLERAIRAGGGELVPGGDHVPRVEDPWLRPAGLRVLDVEGDVMHHVALQADCTHEAPFAAAGDTLWLIGIASGEVYGAPVTARRRIRPDMSLEGADINETGWAHLLGLDAASAKAVESGWFVVVPVRFPTQEITPTPDVTINGLRPVYLKELEAAVQKVSKQYSKFESAASIRSYMYGEDGSGALSYANTATLRGPRGFVHLISVSLKDDFSDHGLDTYVTYIVDARGEAIQRIEGRYTPLAVGDLDGDGVDELLTLGGVVRWDGRAWRFPPAEAPGWGCN